MASITASLEQSLQNCSLNQSSSDGDDGVGFSATSDTPGNLITNNQNNTLELNSNVSLPYQWEQCLDLKTGEIYYINWMNGMKVKEDPRNFMSGDNFTEEDTSYDSEGSSTESSPSPSPSSSSREAFRNIESDEVLVVVGCKSCLMYFMLPKRVEQCPKCNGFLLHFDRSESESSP